MTNIQRVSSVNIDEEANPSTSSSADIKLKREINLFSAVNLIVGVMIGSGIFISPTSALERSGSVALCLIIWAICGFISCLGALAYAELGAVVPRSGAEYAYFIEAFGNLHPFWGPLPSFVTAFVYVFVLRPAEVAVVVLTFAQYSIYPFEHSFLKYLCETDKEYLLKLVALLALGIITFINYVSVKLYVRLQNVFGVCKILACLIIIGGGIYTIATGYTENLEKGFEGSTTSAKDLALAFYSGLWSYDGWSMVTTVTEEIKKPEKNILRSIAIAVPLVTLFYLLMNVSYMAVLSVPEMISAPAVAVEFGDRLLGVFKPIIPVGVAISTFGCALSLQFSVTRLCFVAAREGHMVQALSFVHIRRLTPAPAVTLQGFIAALFIFSGNIVELIDFSSFLIWLFYGLAMVALIILRRTHPKAHRPYKVPYLIPILVILVSLFLALVPIVTDPSPKYLFAVLFILIGVFLYVPFIYYKRCPKVLDRLTYCTQVLLEVVPTEDNHTE